ncbi:hypothetical protein RUND412_000767 [Rhizina undulata]
MKNSILIIAAGIVSSAFAQQECSLCDSLDTRLERCTAAWEGAVRACQAPPCNYAYPDIFSQCQSSSVAASSVASYSGPSLTGTEVYIPPTGISVIATADSTSTTTTELSVIPTESVVASASAGVTSVVESASSAIASIIGGVSSHIQSISSAAVSELHHTTLLSLTVISGFNGSSTTHSTILPTLTTSVTSNGTTTTSTSYASTSTSTSTRSSSSSSSSQRASSTSSGASASQTGAASSLVVSGFSFTGFAALFAAGLWLL